MSTTSYPARTPAALPVERILLTGATGRVGARFLPRLRRLGAEVRLMVWSPTSGTRSSAGLVLGDLADSATCRAAVQDMDAVVHIAAAFQGVEPEQAMEINYRATRELARAALDAGIRRFVQLSSSLVYDAVSTEPAGEDEPLLGTAEISFPAAKLGAERALAELADTDLAGCVLRLAFTYGEGDPHLVEAVAWARTYTGEQRMHLVHHADVRQAVLRVLTAERLARRVYNVGDEAPVDAAELRAATTDFPVPESLPSAIVVEHDTRPFGRLLAVDAIRDELGFRPEFRSVGAAARAGSM